MKNGHGRGTVGREPGVQKGHTHNRYNLQRARRITKKKGSGWVACLGSRSLFVFHSPHEDAIRTPPSIDVPGRSQISKTTIQTQNPRHKQAMPCKAGPQAPLSIHNYRRHARWRAAGTWTKLDPVVTSFHSGRAPPLSPPEALLARPRARLSAPYR